MSFAASPAKLVKQEKEIRKPTNMVYVRVTDENRFQFSQVVFQKMSCICATIAGIEKVHMMAWM